MIEEAAASEELTDVERELRHLRHENEMLTRAGVIEVAVRNPSVMEYMRHWEGRAEKAEAEVARLNRISGGASATYFKDLLFITHPDMPPHVWDGQNMSRLDFSQSPLPTLVEADEG